MFFSKRNCRFQRLFSGLISPLAIKANTAISPQVALKSLPALNFSVDEGIPGLWSSKTTTTLLQLLESYQKKLGQMIAGTDLVGRPILSIIERCVREKNSPQHQRILQQAGLYWNTEFFLRGIHYNPSLSQAIESTEQFYDTHFPKGLARVFESEFQLLTSNSSTKKYAFMERMKDLISIEAESLFGSGWVWLVRVNNNSEQSFPGKGMVSPVNSSGIKLGILSTINGWTPMSLLMITSSSSTTSLSNSSGINFGRPSLTQMLFGSSAIQESASSPFGYYSPVLGISFFENSHLFDFGLDKRAYIDTLWRYINWNRIAVLLNIQ